MENPTIQVAYDARNECLYLFATQEGLRALRGQFLHLAKNVPTSVDLCSLPQVESPRGIVVRMASAAPRTRVGRTMLTRVVRSLFAPYDPRGIILSRSSDGTLVFNWIVDRETWEGYPSYLDPLIESDHAGSFQYLGGLRRHDVEIVVELRRQLPVAGGMAAG